MINDFSLVCILLILVGLCMIVGGLIWKEIENG